MTEIKHKTPLTHLPLRQKTSVYTSSFRQGLTFPPCNNQPEQTKKTGCSLAEDFLNFLLSQWCVKAQICHATLPSGFDCQKPLLERFIKATLMLVIILLPSFPGHLTASHFQHLVIPFSIQAED